MRWEERGCADRQRRNVNEWLRGLLGGWSVSAAVEEQLAVRPALIPLSGTEKVTGFRFYSHTAHTQFVSSS